MLRISNTRHQLSKVFVTEILKQFSSTRTLFGVLFKTCSDNLKNVSALLLSHELFRQTMSSSNLFQHLRALHTRLELVEQLQHYYTHRVNVHLLVVLVAAQLLRSSVKASPHSLRLLVNQTSLSWCLHG